MSDSTSGPSSADQPGDAAGGWQQPGHEAPYASYAGQPYPQPYGQYPGAAYGPGYGAPGAPRDPDRRPGTVTAAAVVTLITSGLVAMLSVLGVIALTTARPEMERQLRAQPELEQAGLGAGDVFAAVLGVLVVIAVWAVLACFFGVLVLRRSNAGRILLVVSASVTMLLSLVAIQSAVSAVPLLAAGAVIVLLFVGGANAWFARTVPRTWSQSPGQAWAPAAGYPGYAPPPYDQQYGQQYGQHPPPYDQQYGQAYPPQQPPQQAPPAAPQEGQEGRVQQPWGRRDSER